MTSDIKIPETAMILAAGNGMRMRPITASCPKPMIMVNGQRLIDRVIAKMAMAGIKRIVINLCAHADMLEDHINRVKQKYPAIEFLFSDERDLLLETGGGVTKALRDGLLPKDQPFYVVNSDIIWRDGPADCFLRLARRWRDDDRALLLLQATAGAVGYQGTGDFFLAEDGTPMRRGDAMVAPFLFTGIQLLHPALFDSQAIQPWSLNVVYDKALVDGDLRCLLHDGDWMDVGNLKSLPLVEAELSHSGYLIH